MKGSRSWRAFEFLWRDTYRYNHRKEEEWYQHIIYHESFKTTKYHARKERPFQQRLSETMKCDSMNPETI
jgi:replication-associated recombination protein RarA